MASTIVRPFVYGSIATHLGKNAIEGSQTHKWSVYVKSLHGEDMSPYVSKVVFKLHESFKDATRVVEKPPYEVSEVGWGEFEIVIKIHFSSPTERPVTLYHTLKLYDTDETVRIGKKHVVSEHYDELVFVEPSDQFYAQLVCPAAMTKKPTPHNKDWDAIERATIMRIDAARVRVRDELAIQATLKMRLEQEVTSLRREASAIAASHNPTSAPQTTVSTPAALLMDMS